MSTASITHHPLPMATAAAAVIVGALAFGAVELTQNNASPSSVTPQTTGMTHGNPHGHPGRSGQIQPPHGGTVKPGLP